MFWVFVAPIVLSLQSTGSRDAGLVAQQYVGSSSQRWNPHPPALEGGFLTTEQGKSLLCVLFTLPDSPGDGMGNLISNMDSPILDWNIGLLCLVQRHPPRSKKAVFLLSSFSDVNKFRWVCDQTLQWKYTNAFPTGDAKLWGKNGTRLLTARRKTPMPASILIYCGTSLRKSKRSAVTAKTLKLPQNDFCRANNYHILPFYALLNNQQFMKTTPS